MTDNARLRANAGEAYGLEQLVGDCGRMREVRQMIQTVAPTDARVLILGESGTGKELVAGALHGLSTRRKGHYIRINCAAIPETLLESELFGHERGAFTGALRQKPGRVEEADGGTIFLDEIADMSRPLQAKLLRFLEDGSFTRVGGTQELRVNVRLLAATNRDIVKAIAADEFREDLFHRLNVVQFRLPPLRERGDDVLLLAEHFLNHFRGTMNKPARELSRAARQKLQAHHWPGNVRELRNVIERALILESATEVQPGSLPDFSVESRLHKDPPARQAVGPAPGDQPLDKLVENYERDVISATLEQNHYSLTRSAEQLKLSRHALRYRMQRLNLSTGTEDEEIITPTRNP
ncbi:MAG TPA: sigma-54 dependent transcriptional regulator, partial [Burkholderiales bacterium]|nr:sigma-54 dependent transcriptional regulator [Burkholderiales bacterium]